MIFDFNDHVFGDILHVSLKQLLGRKRFNSRLW